MVLPYLHERRIYLNRRHTTNQFYTLIKKNDKNFILCFCFNDAKIYVYTETGILVERIFYKEIAEKYGKPVGVSEDGQKFVFRKSDTDPMLYMV